ncbi:hypothetical protein BDC45DRAFT_584698 [Circinella umbellata]|nr:hypothetical protein BDC45DRAFT_584698 [Circinella umbellata]
MVLGLNQGAPVHIPPSLPLAYILSSFFLGRPSLTVFRRRRLANNHFGLSFAEGDWPTITLDCLSPKATGQQSLWTVFRQRRLAKDHFGLSFAKGDWPRITLKILSPKATGQGSSLTLFRRRRLANNHFKILSPKATGEGSSLTLFRQRRLAKDYLIKDGLTAIK